jgi:hypothetical protein
MMNWKDLEESVHGLIEILSHNFQGLRKTKKASVSLANVQAEI